MRALAIHTCPLWEEPDGSRRPGLAFEADHPPVVGWVNVLEVELGDERHLLLVAHYDPDVP